MKAEIFCVGTELLLGDVVNTNAAFLSRELATLGIFVYYHSVCGDNPERLKTCLDIALNRSDIIVMTGGLGPTYDDLTKETVAEKFGLNLKMHEESLDRIVGFYKRLGREMTENNKKQALMPEGAIVFRNDFGTAPALAIEKDGKTVIMLPGPPREMAPLFTNEVKPFLKKYSNSMLFSSNIHIFGIGESYVESKLRDMMEKFTNPTIAPYVNDGEVKIRVTANAKSEVLAKELIAPVIEQINSILGENIYGVDVPSLEFALVKTLTEKKLTIATSESCTGGLISKRITEIPGSSAVFGYGVCTYANEAKTKLLGVASETLEKFGAVSEETAKEMALGVLSLSGADIALSVTGIAGPDGGTAEKPVGLVYVGCACKNGTFTCKKLILGRGNPNERDYIRILAASHALKSALDTARNL